MMVSKTEIRAVIVDSHRSTVELLARELKREGICRVVGSAGSSLEALKICAETKPELVILDVFLAGLNRVGLMRDLRRCHPPVRLLIYSGLNSPNSVNAILRERPHGLVRKQDSLASLIEGISEVCSGRSYFSKPIVAERRDDMVNGRSVLLTERECTVLRMVAGGKRTKEIAATLGISPKTAENHRANLMDKLGIHEVASLTCYAILCGYIDADAPNLRA